MSEEMDNKQQQLTQLQDELKQGGVSRRKFLDRMKGLGVGFGAAFMLGMKKADAHTALDPNVSVKSTNPAIDEIAKDAQTVTPDQPAKDAEPRLQTAQYWRWRYRRWYHRYRRWYYRYRRWYRRW